MIQDEEFEQLIATPERITALGFKPQKELLINHILPYAAELDEESTRFLEQVKTNLAKSVMLREMKPSCGVWTSRLLKYIKMYGLKFGKEEHIAFIKLAYELVLIPDLEPCKIHKFATMFSMLTKKKHLISPEELTLPWRPLYDLGKKIFEKNATCIGLFHYTPRKRETCKKQGSNTLEIIHKFLSGNGLDATFSLFGFTGKDENELPVSLEGSYVSMVLCAKPYFELNATKEILAELLPQIYPWSSDTHSMSQLSIFLPVALPPQYADIGHKLWFDRLMDVWDTCYNAQCGIYDLITVFAELAEKNPGAVDWSPYVPKMFIRILHALNLPVSYRDIQHLKHHSLDTKQVATWVVWSICPDGVVLKHLRSFLAGVESYLHSANSGRWSYRLRDLLRKLAQGFLNRVRREREKKYKNSWENKTPESYKLRDEDITEFVKILLPPSLQAVYSRTGSLDVLIALQNLATLRPAIVIPPLLERLKTSLTSLTEPHRVTAAMSAVGSVARPMLRGADANYPEGPTHVVPLLLAVLPGLDPNDLKKTLVTLHFILVFSSMVSYIDCSSAHEYWPDLTEEELLTCESTAQFEDFVLVFLDRLFVIIESSITEHVRLDTKDSDWIRSKTDAVMETAISSAATAVLMQCSPKIFKETLRKFKAFATESTFETNVSGSMVGVMLRVFARIDSQSTLAAFLPQLCEELMDLLSTDELLREENPPRELVYRLVLLMHVVECDGTVLLKYVPDLIPVLDKILRLHSKYALARACEVLSHILNSLSCIDLKEWKSSSKDYNEAPEKWLPIREWGNGCLLKDANFKWHVPTEDEAACAQMLLDRYLKPEVLRLHQWLNEERPMCRDRRLRSFFIISAVLSCSNFLPAPDQERIILIESLVPATNMTYTSGVRHTVTLDGQNVRVALTRLLSDVQARMLASKTDETRCLEMLSQVWERLVVMKGTRSGPGWEARVRSFSALDRALDGRGGVAGGAAGAAKLRTLLADTARLQDEARLDLVCEAGITPSALQALYALYELSINTYTSVRMLSQIRLYWMLNHYPYSCRVLIQKLAQLLNTGGEGNDWHAQHKGALFIMLGPRSGPLNAKPDWEIIRTLWLAVLKAPLSEKPSILKLEQAFVETVHHHFSTVNTRLKISQSAIDAAKTFLNENQLADPIFLELLNKSEQMEIASSDKIEKTYKDLIEEIVNVAETPNIAWHRLELLMQLLLYCPSVQTAYSPRAVRLMLRSLLHDDITVRRLAVRLVIMALHQRKRHVVKRNVDPYEIAGVPRPDNPIPGYRKDIEWAMWSKDKIPQTDEEWEQPWLKSPNYGFFAWPEKLQVAAPASEQCFSSDVAPEAMEEGERSILEFFRDDGNIERLIAFFTVEEKKGKDKFNTIRFFMFKMLFSQFGEQVADKLLSHALRCASSAQEAPQRFAAELAAAALRAPRYWSRTRTLALHQTALDIIKAGLNAVTPETYEDWGTCVATGVEKLDPRRGDHVLRTLLELCAPPPDCGHAHTDRRTSFVVCARLLALQGALGSLTWRGAPLAAETLKRLESANFLQHPYQNVRDAVGNMLMTIFDLELVFSGGSNGPVPRFEDFLASVRPRLAALYDENGDIVVKSASCPVMQSSTLSPVKRLQQHGVRAVALKHACVTAAVHRATSDELSHHSAQSTEGVDESSETEARTSSECVDNDLMTRLDSALEISGDAAPPTPHDHAQAVNLLSTVFRGCMGIIARGVRGGTLAHYELMELACALASRGAPRAHEELPVAASCYLATVAIALHSPKALTVALGHLHTLALARSWWARLAALDFAQPLLFYGLPALCHHPNDAEHAERLALQLMRDSRLEVRKSAAKLLTGLMHCRALPNEERTLHSLMSSCRSKNLVERHCGVLGLCAYVSSRPYSIGPRLGDVLGELARHTSAPDPIPAAIRTALADFKRTHQDDWPKHREQLTEEELDLLSDLTSPPSYCA